MNNPYNAPPLAQGLSTSGFHFICDRLSEGKDIPNFSVTRQESGQVTLSLEIDGNLLGVWTEPRGIVY
jgi:hypothetical protein